MCVTSGHVYVTVLQVHVPTTSLMLLAFPCDLHNSKALTTAAERAAVPLVPSESVLWVRIGACCCAVVSAKKVRFVSIEKE